MHAPPVILRGTEATVDELSAAVEIARVDAAYALAMLRSGEPGAALRAIDALQRIEAALEAVSS